MYIIVALLVVMSWGFNSAITKIGIENFPLFLFITLRFLGTGLLFLPFAKLEKKDVLNLFKISMSFNVFHMAFNILSLHYLTASSASAILQIQVPMTIILSVIFLKEKVTPIQVLGIIFAAVGVIVIYGVPEVNFLGLVFTLLSALSFSVTQLQVRKYGNFSLTTYLAYTSLFSVPFLFVLHLIFDNSVQLDNITYKFSFSLAYQIVILGFSIAIWQKLISTHGVNKITPFNLLSVVFAIIGGMLMLGETLTIDMFVGTVIMIIGVGMTILFKPKESLIKKFLGRFKKKNTLDVLE